MTLMKKREVLQLSGHSFLQVQHISYFAFFWPNCLKSDNATIRYADLDVAVLV